MSYVPQLKAMLSIAYDAMMFAEEQYKSNLELFKNDDLPAEAMDAYHRELLRAQTRVRDIEITIAKEIEEDKFYDAQ